VCGIAGIARTEPRGVDETILLRMAQALHHRGPDGKGIYAGRRVGFAHARLSIIDLSGGSQPLTNEDGQVVVTFNGEIYNYVELRSELESRGHVFRTRTDTEVLVHGWEQWGEAMLHRLNGQFAFAIYDRRNETVFLARDRFGICPLFYAERNGNLYFASESKALFASGEVPAMPDPAGLDEIYTFWAARAPRTPFLGVRGLQPGHFAVWRHGRLRISQYYQLRYPGASIEPASALDALDELMNSGVSLRMRADVPVGGYLSGGLDSSITCAMAAKQSPHDLRTFSVTFDDPRLDESAFQQRVAAQVGSRHAVQHIGPNAIAEIFPDVIRHTETPLVRTAAAPLFMLSKLTRERGIKVVLTGEGADELFLGYDLFKETVVRLFCLRQPNSRMRPRLFDRLYPYLMQGSRSGGDFWRRFFLQAGWPDDPLFSHLPRWLLTSRIKDFYSADMRVTLAGSDPMADLRATLPGDFAKWAPEHRAAYLEMVTLLEPYLLSSQGERMAMAHGVEGRFPYLDHRLFEYAAALPPGSKLRGLKEKDILRRWAETIIPKDVAQRGKQPYRAPDAASFFGKDRPEYIDELLDPLALAGTGFFDPKAVAGLIKRCETGKATGFAENQALVAILSTQLWYQQFCSTTSSHVAPTFGDADVRLQESVEYA
jgi:asparagine synthase (glutamine-hydrolysing)